MSMNLPAKIGHNPHQVELAFVCADRVVGIRNGRRVFDMPRARLQFRSVPATANLSHPALPLHIVVGQSGTGIRA
jgi:hypothetical protein